jgi:enoyl-CoA hydratase
LEKEGERLNFNTIILEKKENIAHLILNRPEVYNAINEQMITEFRHAIDILDRDESIRVVIITGAGKAFQVGADIAELSLMNPIQILRWNQGIVENFDVLEAMRQPVIAAINGFAFGGGLELALACTMRIASEKAKLSQPEVNLGVMPGAGGTQRLPRLVGKGRAMELVFTTDMIGAEEARAIGLVNRVVPPGALLDEAKKMAKKILSKGPVAIALAKKAIHEGLEMELKEGLKLEAKLFGELFETYDMREGVKAFLEKRAPHFEGR